MHKVYAESTDKSAVNRFNVVIVLDASNSMNATDPYGFRYEAAKQFTDLLAEKGNYLGGVVFSNHVEVNEPVSEVSSQSDKDNVIAKLKSVMSNGVTETMGFTNIGEGLLAAADMICSDGNKELPSVIVFMSDGNTDMPDDKQQAESLEIKAEAIQKARENGIKIYTVCLNANNNAVLSEMQQISDATGGSFVEVKAAEDLQEVFNTFYGLIYNTSSINLASGVFPDDGILNTSFNVPGIGVEEVNIVINGSVTEMILTDPSGKAAEPDITSSEIYSLLKITDVKAGQWNLMTKGAAGNQIKINMVYNTNLEVDIDVPDGMYCAAGEKCRIETRIKSGNIAASSAEQYIGYSCELKICNAYREEIGRVPMNVDSGCFSADYVFSEGTYYLISTVTGNYIEKSSDHFGPVTFAAAGNTEEAEEIAPVINTAPVPVNDKVTKKVNIWPFKGGKLNINMTELAADNEDTELFYRIVSSSFIEGTDYTAENDSISMDHFSLSKGSFDIEAIDSGGLSCNIEVMVTTVNIGLITCIFLGTGILIVLIIIALSVKKLRGMSFRGGTITVNGESKTEQYGRKCYLSQFHIGNIGLNTAKCYFQATDRKDEILFVANEIVESARDKGKVIKISAGIPVKISSVKNEDASFTVKFEPKRSSGRNKR